MSTYTLEISRNFELAELGMQLDQLNYGHHQVRVQYEGGDKTLVRFFTVTSMVEVQIEILQRILEIE